MAFITISYGITQTDLFISGVRLLDEKNYYFEIYGPFYPFLAGLYLIGIVLLIALSFRKLKSLRDINKNRLKYIIFGLILSSLMVFGFLVIQPYFGNLHFENLLILTLLPFFATTFYAIHNYNFSNLRLPIGYLFINFFSLGITFCIIFLIDFFTDNLYIQNSNIWRTQGFYGIFILGIVSFLFIRNGLVTIILGKGTSTFFFSEINKSKKYIPGITHIHDLNSFLISLFKKSFKIKNVSLCYLSKKDLGRTGLSQYFASYNKFDYFINDKTFIQEHKHKLNTQKISIFFHKDSYLIFPLKNVFGDIIGLFQIGRKPFQEHFSKDDVDILIDFKNFLEGHFKYMQTHKKIHELSLNLDKKVDEQTIEYNQLINKQKEFIRYISHEIKSPISSSIFQIDSIIDEVKSDELKKKALMSELDILNNLLLKTGDLVNQLFSVEQFEMKTKSLFKENIHLINMLEKEVHLFETTHPKLKFETNFDKSIAYIEIDKVQFRQVIDNLINNAIKVIDKSKGNIYISCIKKEENIKIEIEDNGVGFTNQDIEKIFDKYTTGKGSSVGLGMGLYLCKTIVELHGGKIQAAFGKKLGGAKIIISIPIQ
ncbi:MAG: hypothetical protein GY828_02390 [Candidatus Gracilibacteria bacterium]|nr:hypothetical protein [Candidatus Gracilibacteria bacterium]